VSFATDTSRKHNRTSKQYQIWLPSLLAFAGLAILVAIGGKSWEHSLPYDEMSPTNSQTLLIETELLQGMAQVPKSAQIGAPAMLNGRLLSADPSVQPESITVYLDGKAAGETEVFLSSVASLNGQNFLVRSWQIDFFLKNMRPGNHTLALQAALPGHEPIALTQSTIFIFR